MNNIKEFIKNYKYPLATGGVAFLLATTVTIFALSTQDSKDTAPTYTQSTKISKSTKSSTPSSTKVDEKKEEVVKEDFTEVDNAVKNAENNQTRENVASAQDLVDKVKDATKKDEFQKRLDLVSHALNVKDAEAQAAVQAQAEVEAQAVAQAQTQAETQPVQETQNQYVAPSDNTYVAPADNGGSTYTPPANTNPPANTQATDPGSWDTQEQADKNGRWTQQVSQPDFWEGKF